MKFKAPKRIVDLDQGEAGIDLIKKFNSVFDELNIHLIDRGNEIEAFKLCLLSRHHLLLIGKHGTSKSKLANLAFGKIQGGRFFKKQFMKETQSDEVFGPMKSERYRVDAIWEHNTAHMLPTAHFAYLDEIFRASDMLLPSMMGILNERIFYNGGVVEECPLITAIGTTNFVTDTEDLEAFVDRWLIQGDVQPLGTGKSRIRMLTNFLSNTNKAGSFISLEELSRLQKMVRSIKLPSEMLELYEALISKYRQQSGSRYISDRRLCDTLRLVQSYHVINELTHEDDFIPEHLVAASYGVCNLNRSEHTDPFNQAFSDIVGNFESSLKEIGRLNSLKKTLNSARVDSKGASVDRCVKLYKQVKIVLTTLENTSQQELPQSTKGMSIFNEIKIDASELLSELALKAQIVVT